MNKVGQISLHSMYTSRIQAKGLKIEFGVSATAAQCLGRMKRILRVVKAMFVSEKGRGPCGWGPLESSTSEAQTFALSCKAGCRKCSGPFRTHVVASITETLQCSLEIHAPVSGTKPEITPISDDDAHQPCCAR